MNIKINRISKNQRFFLLVFIISWLIVQSFLLWRNGVVIGLEASKYIDQAQNFIAFGKLTSNNYWLYSTQIFLIVIALKLQLGFVAVVIFQLALNILATWMFYKLAVFFLKNEILSFLATFVFIINVSYQGYNSYLFTESVFYSLSIIYSSYLLRLQVITKKNVLLLLLMLSLLSITRPTGILFFAATAVYISFRFFLQISPLKKGIIFLSAIVLFLIITNFMLDAGGSLDFMLPFKNENIICGVNTKENVNIKILKNGNSLQGLVYYIIHNTNQFLRLSKEKTILFFGFTRGYYSTLHNIYLMIFFYPLYLLSVVGIIKSLKKKDKIVIFFLIIIFLNWLTVLLTCVNWQNRFILAVTPYIFLMAFGAFSAKKSVN